MGVLREMDSRSSWLRAWGSDPYIVGERKLAAMLGLPRCSQRSRSSCLGMPQRAAQLSAQQGYNVLPLPGRQRLQRPSHCSSWCSQCGMDDSTGMPVLRQAQ